jgi:hypothetical protein
MATPNSISPGLEIHVGFSSKNESLAAMLGVDKRIWSLRHVSEVCIGYAADGCMDIHDVPGCLSVLATFHTRSVDIAVDEIDRLGTIFAGYPDIRIELEQVLLTEYTASTERIRNAIAWTPTPETFEHITLIEQTPKYEAHFSVRAVDGSNINETTKAIADIATSCHLPIHQVIRFTSRDRIVLTTFFDSYEDARDHTPTLAAELARNLTAVDRDLRLKTIVERIILCGFPGK